MSIAKLSFIVTAAAVVLAAINVIIRATTPDQSMLWPMILLAITAAAFLFSLVVISGKKSDTAKDNAAEKTENE